MAVIENASLLFLMDRFYVFPLAAQEFLEKVLDDEGYALAAGDFVMKGNMGASWHEQTATNAEALRKAYKEWVITNARRVGIQGEPYRPWNGFSPFVVEREHTNLVYKLLAPTMVKVNSDQGGFEVAEGAWKVHGSDTARIPSRRSIEKIAARGEGDFALFG